MLEVEAVGHVAQGCHVHQLHRARQGGDQRSQGLGLILVLGGEAVRQLDLERGGLGQQGAQGGQGLSEGARHADHLIVDGRGGRVQAYPEVAHASGDQGLTQPGVDQRPSVGCQAHAQARAPGQANQV